MPCLPQHGRHQRCPRGDGARTPGCARRVMEGRAARHRLESRGASGTACPSTHAARIAVVRSAAAHGPRRPDRAIVAVLLYSGARCRHVAEFVKIDGRAPNSPGSVLPATPESRRYAEPSGVRANGHRTTHGRDRPWPPDVSRPPAGTSMSASTWSALRNRPLAGEDLTPDDQPVPVDPGPAASGTPRPARRILPVSPVARCAAPAPRNAFGPAGISTGQTSRRSHRPEPS